MSGLCILLLILLGYIYSLILMGSLGNIVYVFGHHELIAAVIFIIEDRVLNLKFTDFK